MTIGLTEERELYSGDPVWPDAIDHAPDPLPEGCDIAIVGGGIMGSMLVERLARPGRSLLVLDRREPLSGASRASTAQVSAATDLDLGDLAEMKGKDEAERIWTRLQQASDDLRRHIHAIGLERFLTEHPSLLLEGGEVDRGKLREEYEARVAAGLPYEWLEAGEVERRFGLRGRAAILAPRDFVIDPTGLCAAMIDLARERGARVCWPHDVVGLMPAEGGLELALGDGRAVRAGSVILATGYERAPFHLPPEFTIGSTFVIEASPPPEGEPASFWDSSEPYLYGRRAGGCVLAGGEDVDSGEADSRDSLLPAKAGTIAGKLSALTGRDVSVACRWAASFGSSPDSLPAIGPARNAPHLWLAYGYGGNGVTFAALAADLLAGHFDEDAPLPGWTDPYRFSSEG